MVTFCPALLSILQSHGRGKYFITSGSLFIFAKVPDPPVSKAEAKPLRLIT
jgi:hypothetical protein